MTSPGKHVSYWISSSPTTDYPAQSEDLNVDVAVLGAGIAGITAAYLLKQAGMRVALVEAHRAVNGVTGRTTAKLTSCHSLIYKSLIDGYGKERARLYGHSNQAAIEMVASLVKRHGIECEFERRPFYLYAEREQDRDRLEQEAHAAQSVGLPVTFVEQAPLPFQHYGAVRYDEQAQFHPRKYLLPLLATIPGDGSYVLERTIAHDVSEERPYVVTTDRGRITAPCVLITTHMPFLDRGEYYRRQNPIRSYALGVRVQNPTQDMYISPYPDFHSIRTEMTERGPMLIVAGGSHYAGHVRDTLSYYRDLEEWTRQHFDVLSVDYSWSTQDNNPADGVPLIGHFMPKSTGLYVATGFAGWGMSIGTVAGLLLGDLVLGQPSSWSDLYDPARIWEPHTVRKVAHKEKRGMERGRGQKVKAEPMSPQDVVPGDARVIEHDGKKLAVYREEDGRLHAISAVCTHRGCLINWNNAERTWDCPCHGSRYTVDGEFIHGPTTRNLARQEIEEKVKQPTP
ncbi:MAG: FAD-dependent oxidoreductase [Chloroflexi bacterium]|jgi:glycine/D-amino acid oxidase-like deaminating enzyme/nitrite reductase/ring-hydroxylating ferredoxin subunit|nr:FAD-dependent oxidoreductase [Chloroflexota bacterium]